MAGGDRVVPVTVERVAGDIDGGQLSVGHFEPLAILSFIQFSPNFEAGVGSRCGDQLDDGAIAAQWLAAPVHRDEREETMLDFVPLARPGRQVANRNCNLELVGKPLQLELKGQWSARRGPYRIIYSIDDSTAPITVTAVAHRADVYRRGRRG